MNNHISAPFQLLIVKATGNALVPNGQLEHSLAPLLRIKYLVELAMHQQGIAKRDSIERLAEEFQRQSRIIAEQGGIAAKQKLQLHRLMLDCMAELQDVNAELNDQLLEILLR